MSESRRNKADMQRVSIQLERRLLMRHLSLGSEMAPSITIAYVRMHVGVAALYLFSQTRATNDLYEKQVKIFCRVEHFCKANYN